MDTLRKAQIRHKTLTYVNLSVHSITFLNHITTLCYEMNVFKQSTMRTKYSQRYDHVLMSPFDEDSDLLCGHLAISPL